MPAIHKRTVLVIFAVLLVSFTAGAQELTTMSTSLSSARTSALGGPHAALADDLTTLFSNPAGFYEAKPQTRLSEITLHLGGPIFDIAGIITGGAGGNIAQVLSTPSVQSLLQSIYASMGLVGPISFGYVGKGIGFGIFNDSSFTMETTAPLTVATSIGEQLMLDGGYAFRIPLPAAWNSSLDAGVMLKGGLQGVSYIEKSVLEIPALFSSFGVSTLTANPFYFNTVIGVDAGLRYSYRNLISIGIVGRNLYTPVLQNLYPTLGDFLNNTATPTKSTTLLPIDVGVGALFTPRLGALERIVSNFKLMVDYGHALDFLLYPSTAKNPLLDIGIGTELTLLKILDLRAGFYQGLFSAGLGLNLKFFRLDAAMFGTELSGEPGLNPVFNMIIGLTFQL